jgi:hypothetical protein
MDAGSGRAGLLVRLAPRWRRCPGLLWFHSTGLTALLLSPAIRDHTPPVWRGSPSRSHMYDAHRPAVLFS